MTDLELLKGIKNSKQHHLLQYWNELSSNRKDKYLNQLQSVDLVLMDKLVDKYILNPSVEAISSNFDPVDVIPIPKTAEQLQKAATAKLIGEELLRAGKVTALLVAGGQGSRLGFSGPKGVFVAGPLSKKTLFELHADKIKALIQKYGKPIPWLIMTSKTNDEATKNYFKENDYLGLNKNDVYFFTQGMLPAVDEKGHIIMDAKDHVFTNPNGHGGTLFALKDSGLLNELKKRGIEQIFYFQVDNVLIKICDPYFIGYHAQVNAEMSAKILKKRDAYEKIGVIGRANGKVTVIEYSDMDKELLEKTNPDGSLKYSAGSIAIHMFKREFIERITAVELSLPFHVAHKKIAYIDKNGNHIIPETPNGYKFEMFIFDAFPLSNESIIMEVDRKEDFSPIKNKDGEDSLETAQQDLINYHARLLQKADIAVPFDNDRNVMGKLEINPLFALDEYELKTKLPNNFKLQNNLYLK